MSSLLYFTSEGKGPVSAANVRDWGLGYAFDATPMSCELAGPTKTKGWLFGDAKRHGDAFFGYREEFQHWEKIPGSHVWVGYDPTTRPKPEALARKEMLDGTPLRLGDKNLWVIPQLRFFAGDAGGFEVALPVTARIGEDGEWVSGGVSDEHRELNRVADRLVEAALVTEEDPGEPMSITEAMDAYATLLQANYHISRVEVGLLGLFTVRAKLAEIGRVAIDMETAEEWAQKKRTEPGLRVAAG